MFSKQLSLPKDCGHAGEFYQHSTIFRGGMNENKVNGKILMEINRSRFDLKLRAQRCEQRVHLNEQFNR